MISAVMFSTVTCFGTGVFLKCVANAMMKQRYFARPWDHLLAGAAFGYFGYKYYAWENHLIELVNEKRAERGMPQISRENIFPSNAAPEQS